MNIILTDSANEGKNGHLTGSEILDGEQRMEEVCAGHMCDYYHSY